MSRQYIIDAAKPTPEEQKMLDQKQIINDVRIEEQWAIKAVKYAEVHMNLLKAMSARKLRLSPFEFCICLSLTHIFYL